MPPSAIRLVLCFAAMGALAPSAEAAGDRALGEYLSAECAGCHQTSGRQQGGIPAIIGLPEAQFLAAMAAYASRQRENQLMQTIAGRLSPEEVAALATFYAGLRPSP